jgi:hypothetical protein
MSKGGARSRSGPPPDPRALRRLRKADADGWTELPAEGRQEEPPEWPLTDPSPRELVLWHRWWTKPEALIWELDGSLDYVALTVRMFAEAEVVKASAENRKTVRMMMADLYLTRDAKDRARIRVVADQVADKREDRAAAETSQSSARSRVKVVSSGDGA